jgi:hypothetical protein
VVEIQLKFALARVKHLRKTQSFRHRILLSVYRAHPWFRPELFDKASSDITSSGPRFGRRVRAVSIAPKFRDQFLLPRSALCKSAAGSGRLWPVGGLPSVNPRLRRHDALSFLTLKRSKQ